jgi:hypothetical protein
VHDVSDTTKSAPARIAEFAGWFAELPSAMAYRLWEQGGHDQKPGQCALYEYGAGPMVREPEHLATVERLQAALDASRWRPIETAPNDGSVILLGFTPHPRLGGARRVYEGRWNEGQEKWTSTNGFLALTGASHWMPLPAGPADGVEHNGFPA